MFGLFGNKKIACPVDETKRQWIEYAMKWLFVNFGEEFCKEQKVYASVKELLDDFGLQKASLNDLGDIIAELMQIDKAEFEISVYEEGAREIDTDAGTVLVKTDEEEKTSAGLYLGKNEAGKYDIGIQKNMLKNPVGLLAAIAHEFSHIKLLGENRIKENDEHLTDLVPVVFGLGIFGANSAFTFSQSIDYWGYQSSGYLSQMEWGYALAVHSWLRDEKHPEWINSLPRNIKSDYSKSLLFMENNKEKLFEQSIKKQE